jgi:dTDP-4-dehydrorhamnose reductase
MKILLLGKNGQVGWELQRSLAPLGEVLALDRHNTQHCGDLSKPEHLVRTVLAYQPDFMVNAAAHHCISQACHSPTQLAHKHPKAATDFWLGVAPLAAGCESHVR